MQDAEPCSALKRSPAPQLFPRMNKHVELLAAKAAPLSLPSAVALSRPWMSSELQMGEDRSPGHKTYPPPPIFSRHFCFYFFSPLILLPLPPPSASASRLANTSCSPALLRSLRARIASTDVSFEIEMSCESGSGVEEEKKEISVLMGVRGCWRGGQGGGQQIVMQSFHFHTCYKDVFVLFFVLFIVW